MLTTCALTVDDFPAHHPAALVLPWQAEALLSFRAPSANWGNCHSWPANPALLSDGSPCMYWVTSSLKNAGPAGCRASGSYRPELILHRGGSAAATRKNQ